jgi:hypothetical protein
MILIYFEEIYLYLFFKEKMISRSKLQHTFDIKTRFMEKIFIV